jgi:PhnB protein
VPEAWHAEVPPLGNGASGWQCAKEIIMTEVKAVPEGIHTITPQLTIDGCDQAIEWYRRAFGAELLGRAPDPSGQKVWHAELRVGDSVVYVNDAFPDMGGPAEPAHLWLYAQDIDGWWQRAVDAGATIRMPLADMFWGDRSGTIVDPFGISWSLAERKKNLTPEEMKRAQDEFVASLPKK